MNERKIPKRYIPAVLTRRDKEKQLKSILEQTDRPILKSFKSRRSSWSNLARDFFGEDNTSKEDMARILSKGDKKRYNELMKGFNEIFDKGMKAYYTSGSRPNQTPYSWAFGRLFSVLFGGKSRDIDKNEVEKYNIPLLKQKGKGDKLEYNLGKIHHNLPKTPNKIPSSPSELEEYKKDKEAEEQKFYRKLIGKDDDATKRLLGDKPLTSDLDYETDTESDYEDFDQ